MSKLVPKMFSNFVVYFAIISYATALPVVCYYENWAAYNGRTPENLNASLCSHINYAFLGLAENGTMYMTDDNLDSGLIPRVVALKEINPDLKVLFSVGGANSWIFSPLTADPIKRANFVQSAVNFLTNFSVDGFDIDWEVPYWEDKTNFIQLLTELKTAFQPHGWLLTAAVTANPQEGYDPPAMANILDWINVMTYDFYGTWSKYTGQNSALYPSSVESQYERTNLNIEACTNNWVEAGIPKTKLVVGTAFYGRSFVLSDASQHGLHAPITTDLGIERGTPAYYLICQSYQNWTRVWDDKQKTPYKYNGNGWFGYDDEESLLLKGQYIQQNGFAGAMVWASNYDDLFGVCGSKHILLRQLNAGLGNNV